MAKLLNLHSIFLNRIRKNIGASFVGFENYRDKYSIRIIRGDKTDYFPFVGNPSQANVNSYLEVENIITQFYEQV